MAVSGRKVSGFKNSLSIGSTEAFDIFCDPCKFLGKTVEGKGFCANCQENLCKLCLDTHKSTKASRHHQLLDQLQKVQGGTIVASEDSKICTEYCNIHKKEVIKFFCSQHDTVGCTGCMTFNHRTCTIDYIPDVCSGILKSKVFRGILKNVSKTLKEFKLIKEKSQSKKTENKTSVELIITEIEQFQKEMNDRIEQLKQELVAEANSHKSNRDQEVEKISDSSAAVYSELNRVHIALQDCQSKQLDAQAFVTMKQAQRILSSANFQAYKEDLTRVSATISFEPKNELKNILFQQYGLGKLILSLSNVVKKDKPKVGIGKSTAASVAVTEVHTAVLHSIKQKKTLNVKTKSDLLDGFISGCAVISSDRLLLADCNNSKLKIVNIDSQSVVEEMTVVPYPYDVTVLPQDQVAVTLPNKQEILILGTTEKLTRIRNINVGRSGSGIAYHQDYLYVVCQQPNSLLVLDIRGNVQRDIPLQTAQNQTFRNPFYVAVGKDGHTLHISDWRSQFVASLTLQGNVIGVYTHSELNSPHGLLVSEGSLLVCCGISGTIHCISADLKQGRTMTREVPYTHSICCHPGNGQIYVGGCGKDFSILDYK